MNEQNVENQDVEEVQKNNYSTTDSVTPSYLTKPDKKKNSKVIAIVVIVFVIIAIAGGIFAYRTVKKIQEEKYRQEQENILNEEIEKLSTLDPLSDSVDMTIKTEGDYGKVEQTVKEYFQELFTSVQHMQELQSDERFSILTAANQEAYWKDAPEFKKTTEAINTIKTEMGTACDSISQMLEEDTIKGRLDGNLDTYYKELYQKVMLSTTTNEELQTIKTSMDTAKAQLFAALDKRMEMIDILKKHKDSWEEKNGQLYFTSQSVLDKYNKIVNELNSLTQ